MKDSGIGTGLLTSYSSMPMCASDGLTNGHLLEFFFSFLFLKIPGNIRNLSSVSMKKTKGIIKNVVALVSHTSLLESRYSVIPCF